VIVHVQPNTDEGPQNKKWRKKRQIPESYVHPAGEVDHPECEEYVYKAGKQNGVTTETRRKKNQRRGGSRIHWGNIREGEALGRSTGAKGERCVRGGKELGREKPQRSKWGGKRE